VGRRALTLTEKILCWHLDEQRLPDRIERGRTSLALNPDRVAMQDATGQMAMLQFMQSGRPRTAVPATLHCDHLIRARFGAGDDLREALRENEEVYEFLRTAAAHHGLEFWDPGSGIIHQVLLEKYAFPGGLMIGTDSHTPNAGGLGMLAPGVGGADAAEVMAGLPWVLRAPRVVGIRLTGALRGWTSAKDLALEVCRSLGTSGATGCVLEYFGPGAASLSATSRATVANLGAETGATASLFGCDGRTIGWLRAMGRGRLAELAERYAGHLVADPEVETEPEACFDRVLEIDLDTLEPCLAGPHSPGRVRSLPDLARQIRSGALPADLSAVLIGSCTNSSYEDLERAAQVARQALAAGLRSRVPLFVSPGSRQIADSLRADGQLAAFEGLGATVLASACGPCIGMWRPGSPDPQVLLTTYNRNFPGRQDGHPQTLAFLASPEVAVALALAGRLDCDPAREDVQGIRLRAPAAGEFPSGGLALSWAGHHPPQEATEVRLRPDSVRLEALEPFAAWDGRDFQDLPVLVKTLGPTTTDQISPAGPDWLPLRGHLSGISFNLLLGAIDAETGQAAPAVEREVLGRMRRVSPWALKALELRRRGGSIVVGDHNYGEGSSREHAAMSPRFLGVRAVVARSVARIHEANLARQGILPLTFSDPSDYERVHQGDRLALLDLATLTCAAPVRARVDGREGCFEILLRHSLDAEQIQWFRAGSAMNHSRVQRPPEGSPSHRPP